jgi:hypothetical protein
MKAKNSKWTTNDTFCGNTATHRSHLWWPRHPAPMKTRLCEGVPQFKTTKKVRS